MNEKSADFLQKEAEAVREMYGESIKELNQTEKMAIAGTAAIWTWWLGIQSHQIDMLLVIPVFQTVLAIRASAIYSIMKANRGYLEKIEGKLGLPEGFGWGNQGHDKSRKLRVLSGISFWFILASTSIAGTTFFWFQIKK